MTACFVAVEQGRGVLAGYYTVASSSVPLTDLPEAVAKKSAPLPFRAGCAYGKARR